MKKPIFYLLLILLLTSCGNIRDLIDQFEPPTTDFVDLPDGFQLEELDIGVELPTDISFTSDGRILIGGKQGKVWLFDQDYRGDNPPLFMNITGIVNGSRDRGLMSVRAHPDFPNTPYIYLLFTYDPPETANFANASDSDDQRGRDGEAQRVGRLMRVTADASTNYSKELPGSRVILIGKNSTWENIGNPASIAADDSENWSCHVGGRPNAATIPDCLPADAVTHTVGSIGFGPDGALFITQGDSATDSRVDSRAYRSFDLDSFAGKILRVDALTGEGLPDNPFWDGNPNSNRSKIYSFGLRNPFRFSIHPQTGRPWVGDVGWGTWEEINRIAAGADMGWPCYEGPELQSQYKNTVRCNDYFKTEKSQTSVYAWNRKGRGGAAIGGAFYTGATIQVNDASDKVEFPEAYKNVFFFGDYNAGTIEYVTKEGNNPVKHTVFARDGDETRKRFEFTGMAVAPDGSLYLVTPNFTLSTSVVKRIIYSNRELTKPPSVDNENLPIGTITSHNDGDKFNYNERVNFSGSAKDVDGNTISPENLRWVANLRHFDHPHLAVDTTGSSGSFLIRQHEDDGYMELCLLATDSKSRVGQSCVDLLPNRTSLILQSEPSGIPLTYVDSSNVTTKQSPFTSNVVAHVQRQITAQESVVLNGKSYKFVAWEHEGITDDRAALRFDTKATPMTYKAVYELLE